MPAGLLTAEDIEVNVVPVEVYLAVLFEHLQRQRVAAARAVVAAAQAKAREAAAVAAPPATYLVSVYCLSDNVPAGLFDSEEDAVEFAHRVAREPVNYVERFRRLTEVDPVFYKDSSLLSVDVTEFRGNVPVRRSVVVDLYHDGDFEKAS